MKLLVVCQYYAPEPFRIADICESLVKLGHSVTVVTGTPNYPEGNIYPGYEKGARKEEVLNGVRVIRCPLIPRKTGPIFRLLNYYSFVFSSKWVLRNLKEAFDVVFVNQLSPVMMAESAEGWARRHGKRCVLYCQDLWPESLTAGGLSRDSLLFRFFGRVSRRIYRRADRILCTSKLFTKYFVKEFGIPEEKLGYLPQYAEDLFCQLPEKQENGTFDFLFAGNIGAAQSVDTILGAARRLHNENVMFHIVGSGSELARLQKEAEDLPNVVFYGRRPVEQMPELYASADAMLVTLAAGPVISLTLPGKVQSYMAAGKPIIGAADGEINYQINTAQCGYCGGAEDAQALADNILRFVGDTDRRGMGLRARAYYEANFREELFMEKLVRCLEEMKT